MSTQFRLPDDAYREMHGLLRDRVILLEKRLMATFGDEQLRALWESFDGLETNDEAISGEMVRAEMERRAILYEKGRP